MIIFLGMRIHKLSYCSKYLFLKILIGNSFYYTAEFLYEPFYLLSGLLFV